MDLIYRPKKMVSNIGVICEMTDEDLNTLGKLSCEAALRKRGAVLCYNLFYGG